VFARGQVSNDNLRGRVRGTVSNTPETPGAADLGRAAHVLPEPKDQCSEKTIFDIFG
jgi:hypothetical protein